MSFFDTTPQGRILNRFSKDVDVCDTTLPNNFKFWLNNFFPVVAAVVVIGYTTPLFLIPVIAILVLYYFIQRLISQNF